MVIVVAGHVSGPMKGVFQLFDNIDTGLYDLSLFNFRLKKLSSDVHTENEFDKEAARRNVPVQFFWQSTFNYVSLIRQAIAFQKQGQFDAVQTHGFKPSFLGFFLRIFCGVKWVCFMHGTTNENLKVRFYYWLDNALQRFADRTIVVSSALKDKVLGGRNSHRVMVLHNAVQIEKPMPTSPSALPARQALQVPNDSQLLACVGRFSPEKGTDVLLNAFRMVQDHQRNCHLVLLGDGQEENHLRSLAEELRIADNVHFVGHTNTPGDFVKDADGLVLPSRSEGIPNVVLEAMAMGVPIVATSVGGVPEILEHGRTARLIAPEQPKALAEAILDLLNEPDSSRAMADAANQHVKQEFSVQVRVSKLASIYESIF